MKNSSWELVCGFDEFEQVARSAEANLPADGSIHLGLALQMLFFVADLERSEDDGPRAGMLSVAQPQWVVRIERLAAR